jgi:peptidyl-prolyl cis-trans isomerase-like 4
MAYSKMDGVLVDERRIKVDFSNSVAKLWNQHRRNKLRDEARNIMQDEQKNKEKIYKMNPFA